MTELLAGTEAPEPGPEPDQPELELVELTPDQAREVAKTAHQTLQNNIRQAQDSYWADTRPATTDLWAAAEGRDSANQRIERAKLDQQRAILDLKRARQAQDAAAERARQYPDPGQTDLPAAAQALKQAEDAGQQLLEADPIDLSPDEIDHDFDRANQTYNDYYTTFEEAKLTRRQKQRAHQAHASARQAKIELDQAQRKVEQADLTLQQVQDMADQDTRIWRQADLASARSIQRGLHKLHRDIKRAKEAYQAEMAPALAALVQAKDRLAADRDSAQTAFDQADVSDPPALEQAFWGHEQAEQSLAQVESDLTETETKQKNNLADLAKLIDNIEKDLEPDLNLVERPAA